MAKRSTPKSPKTTEAPEPKAPEPMDPSAPETPTPKPVPTKGRDAYALDRLIEEATSLFPETTFETGNPNQWGARSSVTFVTAGIPGLRDLLILITGDERVQEVTIDDKEGLVEVVLWPSLRTMDSRELFGLDELWEVIGDQFEEGIS